MLHVIQERSLLKNLGSWLGMITISQVWKRPTLIVTDPHFCPLYWTFSFEPVLMHTLYHMQSQVHNCSFVAQRVIYIVYFAEQAFARAPTRSKGMALLVSKFFLWNPSRTIKNKIPVFLSGHIDRCLRARSPHSHSSLRCKGERATHVFCPLPFLPLNETHFILVSYSYKLSL